MREQEYTIARELGVNVVKKFVLKDEVNSDDKIINLEFSDVKLSEEEKELKNKIKIIEEILGPLSEIKP